MTATIRNFVRAIRGYDVIFAGVLFAAWISIRPSVEVPQGYPLHSTFIHAYGTPIVLVLAGAAFVSARLKPPSRRECTNSRPPGGDATPGEPASGKAREPETGEES